MALGWVCSGRWSWRLLITWALHRPRVCWAGAAELPLSSATRAEEMEKGPLPSLLCLAPLHSLPCGCSRPWVSRGSSSLGAPLWKLPGCEAWLSALEKSVDGLDVFPSNDPTKNFTLPLVTRCFIPVALNTCTEGASPKIIYRR